MTEADVARMFAGRFKVVGQCWIWTGSNTGGQTPYGQVRRDGRLQLVHRFVLGLLRGTPLLPDEHSRHSCRRTLCFRPTHLLTVSQLDNMRDRDRDGTTARHERHGKAKLTERQVASLRHRRTEGESLRSLARAFGITHKSVWKITTGQTWR